MSGITGFVEGLGIQTKKLQGSESGVNEALEQANAFAAASESLANRNTKNAGEADLQRIKAREESAARMATRKEEMDKEIARKQVRKAELLASLAADKVKASSASPQRETLQRKSPSQPGKSQSSTKPSSLAAWTGEAAGNSAAATSPAESSNVCIAYKSLAGASSAIVRTGLASVNDGNTFSVSVCGKVTQERARHTRGGLQKVMVWKDIFLELRAGQLELFKKEDKLKSHGIVDLFSVASCSVCIAQEPTFAFEFESPAATKPGLVRWELRTKTRAEASAWVACIERNMERLAASARLSSPAVPAAAPAHATSHAVPTSRAPPSPVSSPSSSSAEAVPSPPLLRNTSSTAAPAGEHQHESDGNETSVTLRGDRGETQLSPHRGAADEETGAARGGLREKETNTVTKSRSRGGLEGGTMNGSSGGSSSSTSPSMDGYNRKWGEDGQEGQEGQEKGGSGSRELGKPLNPMEISSLSGSSGTDSGTDSGVHTREKSGSLSANELFKPDPVYGQGGSGSACACCVVS
jgi:hypothetical protein